MNHGSLFSGIGGFDLAASWMGWENKFHCEWNPFGQQVLKHYWPTAQTYDDITKSDFTIWNGRIDIVTGGFPCQPYSAAGKRLGKEDDRHLWPEMLRAIREVSPRWVVGENVRGLTNWNGGLVFDEVQADLEAIGYEVLPFLLPACAVNAPHRRDRIWFVAYAGHNAGQDEQCQSDGEQKYSVKTWPTGAVSDECGPTQNALRCGCIQRKFEQEGTTNGQQRNTCTRDSDGVCRKQVAGPTTDSHAEERNGRAGSGECEREATEQRRDRVLGTAARLSEIGNASDTFSIGQSGKEHRKEKSGLHSQNCERPNWNNFPTESPVCGRNDGISSELAGITVSKHRNESIKAYGNAIVPQVVYQIFKAIDQYERQNF